MTPEVEGPGQHGLDLVGGPGVAEVLPQAEGDQGELEAAATAAAVLHVVVASFGGQVAHGPTVDDATVRGPSRPGPSRVSRRVPSMAPWTVEDIPDLTGRTAVVTGANSGLGFETALALARAGAKVVLACRDQSKGGRRRSTASAGRCPPPTWRSNRWTWPTWPPWRPSPRRFGAGHDGLDVLVNNAGVMAIPRRETADGFEMQFGTNHLGHFALTGLLLEHLLARPGARVVTVSSSVARMGRMRLRRPPGHRAATANGRAYAQAKLANQLFTLELDRRATGGSALTSSAWRPTRATRPPTCRRSARR